LKLRASSTLKVLTFALGTGVGDLIAERFDLGYGISFLIFAGVIARRWLQGTWRYNRKF
jgi:uncharacterized membrane-anchored protein